MTYEEIFTTAKTMFAKGDATGFDGDFAIQVNISGEGEGAFYIAYKNGALDVAPYEYHDRDALLIATAENFLKIVDGSLGAVPAFLSGKLKVEGSTEKALELERMISYMKKKAKAESKPAENKPANKKGKKK